MDLWTLVNLVRRLPVRNAANPHYDPTKPHHTPEGFRNNFPGRPHGRDDMARFRREMRVWDGRPPPALDLSPVVPDLEFLRANRTRRSVTWIGHSTVLVQMAGRNVLTDPMFSERASPVPFLGPRRHQPPGIALEDLPHIDLVVISHAHYDHLDLPSVRALSRQAGGPPRFAVPLGMERWFRRKLPLAGAPIALDWWDQEEVDGLRISLVPVQHWSARTPWDRNRSLWGGWVVEGAGFRFFFSGDIGYSGDVAEIGRRLGPFDLAAIAIGHYEPRWFMQGSHINPDEAVRIHKEIGAKKSLAIHWGTFERLTREPLDQPPRDLEQAMARHGVPAGNFFTLRHGETLKLE